MSKKPGFQARLPFSKPKAVEPRNLEDINKDWQETAAKQSDAHYRVFIFTEEARNLDLRLKDLNLEAHTRRTLDAEAAKEEKEGTDV